MYMYVRVCTCAHVRVCIYLYSTIIMKYIINTTLLTMTIILLLLQYNTCKDKKAHAIIKSIEEIKDS